MKYGERSTVALLDVIKDALIEILCNDSVLWLQQLLVVKEEFGFWTKAADMIVLHRVLGLLCVTG